MSHVESQDFVVVGRVAKPFGLKGWSRIISFTDPPDNILDYRPWALAKGRELESETGWVQVEDVQTKCRSGGFLAQIGKCRSRTDAEGIAGRLIGVPRTALPTTKSDEYYWFELQGTKVANLRGQDLGRVDEVFDSGAHSVLRIETENNDLMIPLVPEIIREVKPGEQILVDWELDW